jgi:hypothetical protein
MSLAGVRAGIRRLGGMVGYELRMQWRRRGLLVYSAVLCAAILLLGIAIRYWSSEDDPGPALAETLSAALIRRIERIQATGAATIGAIAPVYMFTILGLPIVVADAIPRDREIGVRELLGSLPWGHGIYLAGKLLSVWGAVVCGMAVAAVLSLLAGWALLGAQDVRAHLALWEYSLLPLALYVSGMGTLLPAMQPTRRRAALVGVAFAVYCVAMLLTTSFTLWDALSLARPSSVFAVQQAYLEQEIADLAEEYGSFSHIEPFGQVSIAAGALGLHIPQGLVPLTLGSGVLQVALTWLGVWLWMRWKEA